jgi:23S rRNA pseudouridine2605 synthase
LSSEKLQKVLARAGVGSRRELERWIADGRVRVDGQKATLGDRVEPGARIHVDGRLVNTASLEAPARRVIAYHKPTGELVTRSDPEGRRTVFTRLPRVKGARWIAIGRLDINTAGLLLVTTDGELANRLMHPRHEIARDYAVRVYGRVDEATRQRLTQGVDLEDGRAAFDALAPLDTDRAANEWYRVRLREGRNRLVRRLWESQGLQVSRLMRVQYGPIEMPAGLREGQFDELDTPRINALLEAVGLDPEPARPRPARRPRRR